jgi:hypothetical protein
MLMTGLAHIDAERAFTRAARARRRASIMRLLRREPKTCERLAVYDPAQIRRRGAVLPPISVVPVDDGFAIRDGHHRVSVALARGALTIDATVESLPAP